MAENIKLLKGSHKKFHYTYQTKNLINGKTYLGVHSTDNLNDGYLGSGDRIIQSINKYGKSNFYIQILDFFNSRHDAFEEERFLVTKEWVECRDNYNITLGGYSPPSPLGRRMSDKTKELLRQSRKKYVVSDETRKKISQGGKGRIKTAETLARMSASMKGKNTYKRSKEHIEKIVASRMKSNNYFISEDVKNKIRAAITGIKRTTEEIEKSASKRRGRKASESSKIKRKAWCDSLTKSDIIAWNITKSKPVLVFNIGSDICIGEYYSASEAARILNMSASTVSSIANNNVKNPKKFNFRYK